MIEEKKRKGNKIPKSRRHDTRKGKKGEGGSTGTFPEATTPSRRSFKEYGSRKNRGEREHIKIKEKGSVGDVGVGVPKDKSGSEKAKLLPVGRLASQEKKDKHQARGFDKIRREEVCWSPTHRHRPKGEKEGHEKM